MAEPAGQIEQALTGMIRAACDLYGRYDSDASPGPLATTGGRIYPVGNPGRCLAIVRTPGDAIALTAGRNQLAAVAAAVRELLTAVESWPHPVGAGHVDLVTFGGEQIRSLSDGCGCTRGIPALRAEILTGLAAMFPSLPE